jgi:putative ATP-dependent endonuclease of OLD family
VFISQVRIENFRLFGSGDDAFSLVLRAGLTAIVGENDAGKTAVIDAIRLVLGTRDQEVIRLEPTDFHQPRLGPRATEIQIELTFEGLTNHDRGAFAEYLTYPPTADEAPFLKVTWAAKRTEREGFARRFMPTEWRTGRNGDGPLLDAAARFLLTATYLRPLRDAERAMSSGRGSRISQILQHTKEIKDQGAAFNYQADAPIDPSLLSVLGLGDYASHLIENSAGVMETRKKLNESYLQPLSFAGDQLDARVRISGSAEDATRLRQLLEKLEVSLTGVDSLADAHGRGLGSNNLLFMACELLLLGTEEDGFPLLLIEEPEAHLHPQRQLRLMAFLQDQVKATRLDGQSIQIIITTHSPNLASDVRLDNLVLIRDRKAFPMARGQTELSASDYGFLERFLDVTKANLFFARGVVVVEGDAENILLPELAASLGRDFRDYGVSVVNVGGTGLRRYANIFRRAKPHDPELRMPVACVTDMDVMPDCAPWIIGILGPGETAPVLPGSKRKWRMESDFAVGQLEERRERVAARAAGQCVKSFVSNEWTLEYDLAFYGLAKEVWIAAGLAEDDEKIHAGTLSKGNAIKSALASFEVLEKQNLSPEVLASHVYARFAQDRVSKAIAAQHLAQLIKVRLRGRLTVDNLRAALPPYIVDAIAYVTSPFDVAIAPASVVA